MYNLKLYKPKLFLIIPGLNNCLSQKSCMILKNYTFANTPVSVNKLGMVFKFTAIQIVKLLNNVPGHAQLLAIKILYRDYYLASAGFPSRLCANANL